MSGNFSKTQVNQGAPKFGSSSTAEAAYPPVENQALLLESLSALMDDEADELELRRILKEMPANTGIEGKWQRYHMVRSALQLETHSRPEVNLLAGINARLISESITQPKQSFGFSNSVLRYIGQGAIAASFFAITIIATSVFNGSETDVQPAIAEASNLESPVLGGEYKGSELSRTASANIDTTLDEEALARLSQAVHQEFSGDAATAEIPVSYTLELPATTKEPLRK